MKKIADAFRAAVWYLSKIKELLWAHFSLRRCTQVGRRPNVTGRVVVDNWGVIRLGHKVRIRASHLPVELASGTDGVLDIKDKVFINSGVSISATDSVTIGRNCAIGSYTLIMDNDFHSVGDHTMPAKPRPVVIEDDVWLASRVTVLKGVTIGRGAVVAAGAVVTRDVAPYTLVGGVPARFIRSIPMEKDAESI
jgi:maltose O-acetyltransferase